ncbi:MAG: hypothetical protein AB7N80_09730 [Bdellovibrionales bacterium]
MLWTRGICTLILMCLFTSALAIADEPTVSPVPPPPRPYCLALRGNGELAPAHWGGLAQVVERLGLPAGMAGGSSASISLFLLESIAENPMVKGATLNQQRERASLLLKSLQSYLEVIASRPEWREMMALAAFLQQQGGGQGMEFKEWLKMMVESQPDKLIDLVMTNMDKIQASLQIAIEMGLINPQTFAPLFVALNDLKEATTPEQKAGAAARVNFYSSEIYRSVVLLGKFDAESDHNLFFRSGLVSFNQLATSFGLVGNFYAGRDLTPTLRADLQSFVQLCAPLAKKKTWNQLRTAEPACDQKFKALVVGYKQADLPTTSPDRHLEPVGRYIATFPTTAVLRGSAYQAVKAAQGRYHQDMNPEFGKNFAVDSNDIRFGYWGQNQDLVKIEQTLKNNYPNDAKSQRFFALGESSWAQVMALSPAEPGLAPMLEFKKGTEPLFSAGGWSDLHPALVLKAQGCEQVVYVTRRGGESLFGQGVAKRLFGFAEVPWEQISTREEMKAINKVRNNQGKPEDQTSLWSRLYNLANQESSYNLALKTFDGVLCTDWNRFDIIEEGAIAGMIDEAYQAPWALKRLDTPLGREAIRRGWRIALTRDNGVDPQLGYRPFAGCLPF